MSITKGEKILLAGLQQVARKLGDVHSHHTEVINRSEALIDGVITAYEVESRARKPPVQFNPGVYEIKRPLEWYENGFKDFHPAVRGTTYMEVHQLIGTAGVSPEEPYWIWSTMGVIETTRGKLLVCPNDWVLEPSEGFYIVMPDDVYRKHYQEV